MSFYKQFNGFQSYHTGIEMTYFESVCSNVVCFQSYHTGIEILLAPSLTPVNRFFQSYHTGIEIGGVRLPGRT